MPVNINNGTIEEITSERGQTFVTVTYYQNMRGRRNRQMIRLVVNSRTIILNANGRPVPVSVLRRGMRIDAVVSSAMTRSIPPQAVAYLIRIVNAEARENITNGIILDVDRRERRVTVMGNRDGIIVFHITEDTRIIDRIGRPTDLSNLRNGMRVRVRHANFMTASIPPQTTAFEIQIV